VERVPVERRRGLSPADFARDHVLGGGKPVIITDATEHWPARSKWTFEFLRAAYGSDIVAAPHEWQSDVVKLTKLAAYIDHLDIPARDVPGLWVEMRDGHPLPAAPKPPASPLYLLGWHAFQKHPELYDDIKPAPYFISDWVLALEPTLRDVFQWTCEKEYWSVYVGPEGSLSPLHRDFWGTHAYLAQIRGRKRAILFAPEDSEFLYGGRVDPAEPDLERFGLFGRATAYECVIEPGDLLYVPPDWWHWVRGLEKSVTVSHNFFNEFNVNEHLTQLVRNLPRLVRGFDRFPGWRERMCVEWLSAGCSDRDGDWPPAVT
jgi:hypothetical protein